MIDNTTELLIKLDEVLSILNRMNNSSNINEDNINYLKTRVTDLSSDIRDSRMKTDDTYRLIMMLIDEVHELNTKVESIKSPLTTSSTSNNPNNSSDDNKSSSTVKDTAIPLAIITGVSSILIEVAKIVAQYITTMK